MVAEGDLAWAVEGGRRSAPAPRRIPRCGPTWAVRPRRVAQAGCGGAWLKYDDIRRAEALTTAPWIALQAGNDATPSGSVTSLGGAITSAAYGQPVPMWRSRVPSAA